MSEEVPVQQRQFLAADLLIAALTGATRIDPEQFREDIDAELDQNPTPRDGHIAGLLEEGTVREFR